jgi:hypothetical protein
MDRLSVTPSTVQSEGKNSPLHDPGKMPLRPELLRPPDTQGSVRAVLVVVDPPRLDLEIHILIDPLRISS